MKVFVSGLFSKVFVLFLFLSAVVYSCTPPSPTVNGSVPPAVLQAFNTTHPNVSAQWESRPYGYEATFVQDGVQYEVEYSSAGKWLETEYEVQERQFPPAVLQAVRRQHPNHTITKYEIELTPLGTFYELELERDGVEIEVYFDALGQRATNLNEDA